MSLQGLGSVPIEMPGAKVARKPHPIGHVDSKQRVQAVVVDDEDEQVIEDNFEAEMNTKPRVRPNASAISAEKFLWAGVLLLAVFMATR